MSTDKRDITHINRFASMSRSVTPWLTQLCEGRIRLLHRRIEFLITDSTICPCRARFKEGNHEKWMTRVSGPTFRRFSDRRALIVTCEIAVRTKLRFSALPKRPCHWLRGK